MKMRNRFCNRPAFSLVRRYRPVIEPLESRQLLSAAYTLTALPGDPVGTVQAFNDAGQAAGSYDKAAATGFLYSGGRVSTFSAGSGNSLTVTAMNSGGGVVGYITYQSVGGDSNVGFEYTGGTFTILAMPMGTTGSIPVAINNSNVVAGTYTLQDGTSHGFEYANGHATDIGTLGGANTVVTGMNNSDDVVGYSNLANGDTHAFLYNGGRITDINPTGGTYSEADAINDAGDVIGYQDSGTTAFDYQDGQVTTVAPPFGGTLKDIHLDAAGEMVGHAVSGMSGDDELFAYTGQTAQDDGLLSDDGGIAGSTLTVTGVNNQGTIIGESTNIKTGVQTPFVYQNNAFQSVKIVGSPSVALHSLNFINTSGQVIGDNPSGANVNSYVLSEDGWISGTVFNDTNRDGIEDDGEFGTGATLYIDPYYKKKFEAGDIVASTDSSGNYVFTDPGSNPQIVRVELPSGWVQSFPAKGIGQYVGPNTGMTHSGLNFGIYQNLPTTASISGIVYNDITKSDLYTGQAGIPNVRVYIDVNNLDSYVSTDPSAITNAQGQYTISGLTAGADTVREVVPAGDTQIDPPPTEGIVVTLTTGQASCGADFGIYQNVTASISGIVYDDVSKSDLGYTDEAGVPNVRVYVDVNNLNSYVSTDPSAITNAQGQYTIGGLTAGADTVREVVPAGDTQIVPPPTAGIVVTLTPGEVYSGANFGLGVPTPPQTGSISGTVFNDVSGKRVVTNGPYLAGVTVFLDTNQNGKLDPGEETTKTDANGNFVLTGISDGTHYVGVVPPAGFRQDIPSAGNDLFTTVGENFNAGVGFFGLTPTAYIGGILFVDHNGNGVRDPGENLIYGWTVYLDLNNDGIHESNEPLAVSKTNSAGYWYFPAVAPGTYVIRAIPPAGWKLTHAFTVTVKNGQMVVDGEIGAVET